MCLPAVVKRGREGDAVNGQDYPRDRRLRAGRQGFELKFQLRQRLLWLQVSLRFRQPM